VYHNFSRGANVVDDPIKLYPEAETFTAWDFGTADPTFIIVGQILKLPEGEIINIIDEYTNNNEAVDHYGKWCKGREWFKFGMRNDYGDPAGKNRDSQLKSWITQLWPHGIKIKYTHAYNIEEYCDAANNILDKVRICEKQCPKTVEMFENWKYPLDNDGNKKIGANPNHDQFSHPGTAFYYFAANRFGSKKAKMIV
jgi:hypothetical protein